MSRTRRIACIVIGTALLLCGAWGLGVMASLAGEYGVVEYFGRATFGQYVALYGSAIFLFLGGLLIKSGATGR